ncbi:phospho-sugar mutase [bacterium]|nr:phospho-sugar mutase [bacterium]
MTIQELNFSKPEIAQRVEEWTSDKFDAKTRGEIQALVDAGDVAELEDRFYRTLEFGTGGLRGVVGAGTNRMNETIVSWATQGLANYVKENATKPGPLRAAISHDCRNFSREFAETAAAVLAANGIIVHITRELRPTPFTSFVCKELGCHTGIMVTASHNPKEYNGYKVYWDDGSQVVPPHDKGIIAEVAKITDMSQVQTMDFQEGIAKGMIKIIGEDLEDAYLAAVKRQQFSPELCKNSGLRVVYTPLHGVGSTMAVRALRGWGFTEVFPEEEQMKPDGNFPTAASPNPEEGAALGRAIELAKKVRGELVLATDPDADRLGIAVQHNGEYVLVTGNQLSAMACDFVLAQHKRTGRMPKKPGTVTTIVTSPLVQEVAESHGALCPLVLTGFKWIARQIRQWEAEDPEVEFLYGTEESYGYMIGGHCRDKDGIVASCVVAEMAAWAKSEGMTLIDYLENLYLRFEPRVEWQKSVVMPGQEGAGKIKAIMDRIRNDPPKAIGSDKVVRRTRIDVGKIYDGQTGEEIGTVDQPSSDVVLFDLEDGSKAIARPSGTEPKIKFYFFLAAEKQQDEDGVRAALRQLNERKPQFQKEFLNAIGVDV